MKKKSIFTRILRRLNRIIDRYIRFFVNLFPRDSHLIVYGGALDLFIDNSKHLFIYNCSDCRSLKGFRHIWLTRKESTYTTIKNINLPVLKSNGIKGWYYMLRAGVVVFDNEIHEFSRYNLTEGATRIELWHGLPLKFWGQIKDDNQEAYIPRSWFCEKFIEIHPHGDYTICAHINQRNFFSAAFNIPVEKVILSGYPRLRCFYMDENERDAYIRKYEKKSLYDIYTELKSLQKYKIIYMPTFRDGNPRYINSAIPDWSILNEICSKNNSILYLKVHRVTPLPKLDSFSNIKVLDSELDIYPILNQIDMLITDYSSIMYDFALLNKPVVLYTYDIDGYRQNSRKLTMRFLELKEKLTNVEKFDMLLNVIGSDKKSIKRFPVNDYYQIPNNFEAINRLIEKKHY